MRKPDFCICENKGAYQLHSNCATDLRLCFRYIDSTIPLLSKFEISNIQPGYCRTWSITPNTGFLMKSLKLCVNSIESLLFNIVRTFYNRIRELLFLQSVILSLTIPTQNRNNQIRNIAMTVDKMGALFSDNYRTLPFLRNIATVLVHMCFASTKPCSGDFCLYTEHNVQWINV